MTFAIDPRTAALVITDPQKDVLYPTGALGDLFAARALARGVIPHMVQLKQAAERAGIPVLVSRVVWTEHDLRDWPAATPFQRLLIERKAMSGGGAEFVDELGTGAEPVSLTPRQGPTGFWGNDIDVQLRQRSRSHVILCGMVANLCLEANVRDAVTHGYEVTVVKDATDSSSEEAYQGALANFALLASRLVTTAEAVAALSAAASRAA